MVEPQAFDIAALDQVEDEPVRVAEAVRALHPHRAERVDVEETPVVDLLGGDAPRRGAPVLRLDDALDQRLAVGGGARRVEPRDERARVLLLGLREEPPRRRGGGASRRAVGDRLERREERRERRQRRRVGAVEDERVRRRREREEMLEVAQREAVEILPAQLAIVENVTVLLAEERQQYFSAQLGAQRTPVDVEVVGVVRVLAPGEQIEPPRVVVAADPHVVRDEVQDVAHSVRAQRRDERPVVVGVAELGVERVVIDDVVAVQRTGARFEIRRAVDVRDPEPLQIGDERGRVGEAEAGVELQAVRRARRHRAGPPTA